MIRGREIYSGLERRRHVRRDVQTTFWLMTPDGASLLMKSMNVSAGGAFLGLWEGDANVLPATGTRLRFVLTAVDPEASGEAMEAEVVRKSAAGMAIQFISRI